MPTRLQKNDAALTAAQNQTALATKRFRALRDEYVRGLPISMDTLERASRHMEACEDHEYKVSCGIASQPPKDLG